MIALWQRRWLWLSLLIAIVMRIFVWVVLPRNGWISDEGEYLSAATWLSYGRGFAWYLDFLWTRAPLYPLFVAAHLRLGGNEYWVFFSQMLLSLLHVVLVRAIAQRLYPIQAAVADMAGLYTIATGTGFGGSCKESLRYKRTR
jgi:4-amino-4-deoxy-L-arabinose transferase-like glycosyltransferase